MIGPMHRGLLVWGDLTVLWPTTPEHDPRSHRGRGARSGEESKVQMGRYDMCQAVEMP